MSSAILLGKGRAFAVLVQAIIFEGRGCQIRWVLSTDKARTRHTRCELSLCSGCVDIGVF